MNKDQIKEKISELETVMYAADFWSDKDKAQSVIKEIQDLKELLDGVGKYDKLSATITIFAGVGGDDAEDFVAMLYRMYSKYVDSKGWTQKILHEHQVDHGGYRNITVEIGGKNAYGTLKNESGVHRLVRQSPFNSAAKRQTSFAMVEVVPVLADLNEIEIDDQELKIEFTKSSGPGGQNANKRETAVRIVHVPTNLSAGSQSERTQESNREKAMNLLKGKLIKKMEDDRKKEEQGLAISKTVEIEWGNQIRNYVLHPYKMVKDLRTNVETSDVGKILDDGEIDEFIEAEKEL
jgi:peptide chain release factor 2